MEIKVKLWAGVTAPEIKNNSSSFDIEVNSFKKIYKGKKEMDCTGIMKNSISDGVITLRPFERVVIGTGLSFEVPQGYRLQIVSAKTTVVATGLVLACSPMFIDPIDTEELTLVLHNSSQFLNRVEVGDIVARGSIVEAIVPKFIV